MGKGEASYFREKRLGARTKEVDPLVEMDFSRYDKDDKEFLRSTGYYVLTKNMGYWQILSLNSIGSVTGVK